MGQKISRLISKVVEVAVSVAEVAADPCGRKSLHMPKNCRKNLDISLGPRPGSHSVERLFFGRTWSKCFY